MRGKDWVKEPYDYRQENVIITVDGQMQCRVCGEQKSLTEAATAARSTKTCKVCYKKKRLLQEKGSRGRGKS